MGVSAPTRIGASAPEPDRRIVLARLRKNLWVLLHSRMMK